MLVILSDIHFVDGSSANNVKAEVFSKILKPEILYNAKHREAKEIRIVLLGDIFDVVRTDYWFCKNIDMKNRPWGGELNPLTAMNKKNALIKSQFEEILDDILNTKSAKALIKMVNDIAVKSGVYTKLTYIVGNHDRVLWNYPSLQDKIREKFDKVTSGGQQNNRVEFLDVLYTPEYGVIGRHGHEWDEVCHGWEFYNEVLNPNNPIKRFDKNAYKVMAIGEVVTAELMSGIVYHLSVNPVTKNDVEFLDKMRDLNNVRPTLDVFRWIDWFMRNNLSAEYKKAIYDSLSDSLKSLLNSTLVDWWDDMQVDTLVTGDLADRLQLLNTALKSFDYAKVKSLVLKFFPVFNIFNGSEDSYAESAKKEWEWLSNEDLNKIQYIVYGHTHQAKHVFFSGTPNDKVKMYINTGTYMPLIEMTEDKKGFASAKQMSMLFFYRQDEDTNERGNNTGLPTMALWNGIRRKNYK
jgi:UDP-2,3-diacylglucosamine pyrophosphatase LpxH